MSTQGMQYRRQLCRKLSTLALFAWLAWTPSAAAEETPTVEAASATQQLLADDNALIHWVSERHPALRAAAQRRRGAVESVEASRVFLNPELSAGISGISLGRPTPRDVRFGETMALSVGLSETVELGKRTHRTSAAQHRSRATDAAYDVALAQQVHDARAALGQVLYLVGRQQILDQRATSATDVLGLAKTRFEHGDISGTDLDRLTLEEASVAREAAENLADLAEATSLCEEALTAPCKLTTASVSALATSARLPERLPDATPSAPHVPAARQLEELRLAVLGDAALARARVIPDPTVSVGYTRDWYTKAGNQPHTVGVSVSVPLPVLDTGYHAAEAASAEAQALADEVRAQLSHQRASIHGMLGRKGAIEGKLRTIRNDLLPRANDLEKSAQTAYLHGQLSMSGLVLVRRDLLSLRLDEVDTEYQLFQVRNQLRQLFQLDLSQARRTEPSNPRP